MGSPGIRNRIDVIAPPYVPETYMAVSRMIDGVIAIPYVNGSASTTPMTSVRPGSTATSIPTISPTTSARKFVGASTCTKPPASCCSTSHIASANPHQLHQQQRHAGERRAPDRQRQVDDLHENEHEHERAAERDGDDHRPAGVASRTRQRSDVKHGVEEESERAKQRNVGNRHCDAGCEQCRIVS